MKKIKQKFTLLAALALGVSVFFACKKQDVQSSTSSVDNTVAIKNAVQQFSESFVKTASESERKNVTAILQHLEYGSAAMIALGDTATLYVVRMNQGSTTTEKFMAVLQEHGEYGFDGLYEAKNIAAIKSVFTTNRLPKGDSVYVRGLNGYPTKEWITASNGTLTYRVARSSKIKDIAKLKQAQLSDAKYQLNNVIEPCIYWYWWEYYPGYGWVPVDFLYTTGCDGGGTAGGPVEEPDEVNLEAFQQMMDDYAESSPDEGNNNYTASPSPADGIDPVMGIVSWTVGKHLLHAWSVIADTKYGYYHTEYFYIPLMRMVQNYNVFLYKTDAINFIGTNAAITSAWTTTSQIDQILNNNTENAKGKTTVAGIIEHKTKVKVMIKGVEVEKEVGSVTHVDAKTIEIIFQ
ncbi:MAG: hypothetical protein V4557_04235 [Bacteroidota bacterium]